MAKSLNWAWKALRHLKFTLRNLKHYDCAIVSTSWNRNKIWLLSEGRIHFPYRQPSCVVEDMLLQTIWWRLVLSASLLQRSHSFSNRCRYGRKLFIVSPAIILSFEGLVIIRVVLVCVHPKKSLFHQTCSTLIFEYWWKHRVHWNINAPWITALTKLGKFFFPLQGDIHVLDEIAKG